jgi:hypothetical protein
MDVRLGMLLGILKESCSPSLIDMRSILRIWWPKIISNEDLWKLTESGDICRLNEENLDGSDTH